MQPRAMDILKARQRSSVTTFAIHAKDWQGRATTGPQRKAIDANFLQLDAEVRALQEGGERAHGEHVRHQHARGGDRARLDCSNAQVHSPRRQICLSPSRWSVHSTREVLQSNVPAETQRVGCGLRLETEREPEAACCEHSSKGSQRMIEVSSSEQNNTAAPKDVDSCICAEQKHGLSQNPQHIRQVDLLARNDNR